MPAACSETPIFPTSVLGPATGDPRTAASVRGMGDSLNQRCRYLLFLLMQQFGAIAPVGGPPSPIVSCNVATGVFYLPGHGLAPNNPTRLMFGAAGLTLPTLTPEGQILYSIVVDADHFQLAATSGGPALTSLGSALVGEAYAIVVDDPEIYVPAVGPVLPNKLSAALALYAPLASANTWAGLQTFLASIVVNGIIQGNNGLVLNGNMIQGGGNASFGQNVSVAGIFSPQAAEAPKSKTITPTATTFTVDASAPVWICDTPFPGSVSGGTMVITVDSTTLVPAADQEIEIVCLNLATHSVSQIIIERAGPTNIVSFTSPDKTASVRLKFIAGVWRVIGYPTGPSTTCGAS